MKDRHTKIPYLIIILLCLATAAVVDPRGEFPLNDDWSYTRTALTFARGAGMHVDEWSAPSLVGQALYGGLLIRTFGMKFLALRAATLLAACGVAMALFFSLTRLGVHKPIIWVAVLSWIFSPLQLPLSFTYMTEIPFIFFIALSLVFFLEYVSNRRSWALVAAGAVLGYAFLIRQTAVLFAAALVFTLLLEQRQNFRMRIRRALIVGSTAGAFIAGYCIWLENHGGATPATRRKFELLRHLTVEQLAGNSFGLLFYIAFLLAPLWIALVPTLVRLVREFTRKAKIATIASWMALSGTGLWWFHSRYSNEPYFPSKPFHSRMPFLLNVVYDSGLGPVTLDPGYFGPSPLPTYPWLWIAVTLLVAAGLVVLGLLLTFFIFGKPLRESSSRLVFVFMTVAFFAVAVFEIVFSHLQEGGLFDRHLLIPAFAVCVAVCLVASRRANETTPSGRASLTGAACALALLASFTISATHDYLAWNRIRWRLGNAALASGVNPLNISAGFEFNGWHNYDVFRTRGNVERVYRWWYDNRQYLVTMSPQPGYHILEQEAFFSWVHRRKVPLYLLQEREP
jgi:hypothetical protein